jgi:glycosyltransferase involved in cell wall biosynthesis
LDPPKRRGFSEGERLKVAVVCSYYPWPPSIGGVETIVRDVSTELAIRGHEVHIVTSPLSATTRKEVSTYGIEENDGVIIHKLRPSILRTGNARLLEGLSNALDKIKPDIVHSHNLHPHLFQLAKWKSRIGYKLLAELHYPVANLESLLAKAILPVALKLLARTSHDIDLFIAHAEIERRWLIENDIDPRRVCNIMFPFVPSHLTNSERNNNAQKSGDLIFVGRVVWIKGLHILVKALKLANDTIGDVKLTIIGPCNESYLLRLKRLIDKEGLSEKVTIRGIVSNTEKYRLMMTHKVLVLPSLGDFTPGVLLEGQALGTPVIATRVGAVPEIMVDGETGILVRPGDAAELAKAITTLLPDYDLRRKMSIRAEGFSKNFLPGTTIRRLEAVYRGLFK